MPTDSDIREQLLHAIHKADMPLFALAREAGIQQSNLWRFVNGECDLRLATAAKVAHVLNLTLVYKPKPRG